MMNASTANATVMVELSVREAVVASAGMDQPI